MAKLILKAPYYKPGHRVAQLKEFAEIRKL